MIIRLALAQFALFIFVLLLKAQIINITILTIGINIISFVIIHSLVDIIFIKFKNGDNVINEISYLENLLPNNKKESFEKLYLIEFKNFYGLHNLKDEFNISVKRYINLNFLKDKKNSVLNFLFKFVVIKPNDLSVFENEELNILMSAKKLMEKEDIKNALSQIMRIDNNQAIFLKWINQAEIYLEFKNEIEKVI